MHLPVSPSPRLSPSVFLYLTYTVVCRHSCMTSYPFPVKPHRKGWCNEAWQNRTLSSAAKWSKSPQPPQTNTSTTNARVGSFFWPPLMPGGKARWHGSMLGLEPERWKRSEGNLWYYRVEERSGLRFKNIYGNHVEGSGLVLPVASAWK